MFEGSGDEHKIKIRLQFSKNSLKRKNLPDEFENLSNEFEALSDAPTKELTGKLNLENDLLHNDSKDVETELGEEIYQKFFEEATQDVISFENEAHLYDNSSECREADEVYEKFISLSGNDSNPQNISDPHGYERSFFEPVCKICNKKFSSRSCYLFHVEDAKHKRRADEAKHSAEVNCDICKVTFNKRFQYEAHVNSKAHKKRVKEYNLAVQLNVNHTVVQPQEGKPISEITFQCEPCGKKISMIQYNEHMTGKFHLKMQRAVAEMAVDRTNKCRYCRLKFSEVIAFENHKSSVEHIDNVRQEVYVELRKEKVERNKINRAKKLSKKAFSGDAVPRKKDQFQKNR